MGKLTKTVSYLWCLPFAENFSALFLPETWVGGNVEIMTTLKKQIPKFDSEDEEREFWATHDSTNYIDWSEAKRVGMPNLKPSSSSPPDKTVSITLPQSVIDDLKVLAHKRDIPYESLLKIYLAERVDQEMRS